MRRGGRSGSLSLLLGLTLALPGAAPGQDQQKGVPGMSAAQNRVTRMEQWRRPVTQERVTLTFDGNVTRLEGGVVLRWEPGEEFRQWNPLLLGALRDQARMEATSEEDRARRVSALGFPPELWEELDAFRRQQGLSLSPVPGKGKPQVPVEYRSSLVTLTQEGQSQNSLLWNPTPEMQRRFAELVSGLVQASAPPDTAFHQQGQELRAQGFVRLAAEPGREPKLWESKVGGVPYRPKGAAWPRAHGADTRPLVFLVQINFGTVTRMVGRCPTFPRGASCNSSS